MDAKQNPRDQHPGGPHNSDEWTHAKASLPAGDVFDRAVASLSRFTDQELEDCSTQLDAAVAAAGNESIDNDLVTVAAAARILLRRRKADAARDRGRALVRKLISTETPE